MAKEKLREKLVDYLQDAHAMEHAILYQLDGMISTTDDPRIEEMLRHHRAQTEHHEKLLRGRLEAHGADASTRKEAETLVGAFTMDTIDELRCDQAGKNARDGYVTERAEIAAYQLLERLADRAGDQETAEVARRNRAEEEEMARKIDANWDRFLELTLREANIQA